MAHSILHLLPDVDASLRETRKRLKPGGWFISSTVCLRDRSWLLSKLLPLASVTRLIPLVTPLGSQELQDRIAATGFEVVEAWQPKPGAAVFIIARAV